MATLREGIIIGNNYVDQLKQASSELASMSQDIINYLNGNSNFQIFREGTEKGEAIYNNLNTCVKTIIERLVPTIDNVSTTTSRMLNEQQQLNRADKETREEWV